MPPPTQNPAPTPPAYNPTNPFGGTNTSGPPAGGPVINPRGNAPPPPPDADALLRDITREQFADYQQRYRPLERQYAKFLLDDDWIEQGAVKADQRVRAAYQTSAEITGREQERYGLDITPDQARSMARMRNIGLSTGRGVARNATTAALDDVRTQGLNTMAGYGRGLADQSQGLASGIANRQAGIDGANDQLAAQEDAQRMQALATIAIFALSSRDYKHNIVSVDAEILSDELKRMRVVEYDYQPGLAVQGHHVGLIAEETPARYLSADGKQVNLYSLIGALISANQQLIQRVESLEELSDGR